MGVPLLVVGVVGVKTWAPLKEAGAVLEELDRSLGPEAAYLPSPSGEILPERMELFLKLRTSLVAACDDYDVVRKGFDSIASLESKDSGDLQDVGSVAKDFGGASLSITPFLARFFERRNDALLAASMGLQEYSYIYALAYHDHLLFEQTRNEIFSDGDALSPEASLQLRECLRRQLEAVTQADIENPGLVALKAELEKLDNDHSRLIWQDGLPDAIEAGLMPYSEQLDRLFCGATAGLEMERDAHRALRIAIE